MISNFIIKIIKMYQRAPIGTHSRCKYYPTCSNYAIKAFEVHGLFKGLILTIWRLLRCNPFSKGGVDYVKEKK